MLEAVAFSATRFNMAQLQDGYNTLLHVASQNQSYESAKFLVEHCGLNPNTRNEQGKSSIDLANGDKKMVQILTVKY